VRGATTGTRIVWEVVGNVVVVALCPSALV